MNSGLKKKISKTSHSNQEEIMAGIKPLTNILTSP